MILTEETRLFGGGVPRVRAGLLQVDDGVIGRSCRNPAMQAVNG